MRRALLTLALFAFPAEFRSGYRSQLFADLDQRGNEPGYSLRWLFEVLASGISMRTELLWRDITYAVRVLAKAPLFTCVVAGTLAAAIASNAVIFSALEAVLLKPLPYAHTGTPLRVTAASLRAAERQHHNR
jgi:hypothetical protein